MKTKSLFRNVIISITYVLVFFWTSFSAKAQCPSISDPLPPAICDASGFTFNDLNTYATDNGNGIIWYDVATGGIPFSGVQLVSEGTYYADDISGSCGSRLSITIDFVINPSNENFDAIYCSNENATIQTYIDDILQTSIPIGGTVAIYNDADLTDQANTTDIIPTGANNYFIVFIDNSGCESQIEIGTTAIFAAPSDPTPVSNQTFCSDANPTIADLDPGTTASFSWYQNIDGSGNPIPPPLSPTTTLVNGSIYYVQIDDVFCDSNPVAVSVTIDTPNEAGSSASLDYCSDSIPGSDFNLFDELGGTPDNNGTWSGPVTTTNDNLGTVNISTLTNPGDYVFTYTVPSNGVCGQSGANVTITIHQPFTSGVPSSDNPASFCESSVPSAFDLFTLLEGQDPNGQWTEGTLSTDPVVTSTIDFTGFTPGTYNYTYTQNLLPNPCTEESTTVQVIVLPDPNAGIAVNQTFCENDLAGNSPFDLFNALDGSQDDNNGTWTDATNATISNTLDITAFTVAGSPYTFNYTIDNGTCSDTEAITITIEPAPESGTVNPPVAFCISEITTAQTVDLFTLLEGEDQTGTWIDDDASGALTGNTVTIDGLVANTYNFTYDVAAIGSCDDVLVTVSIIINDASAPTAASPQEFCDTATVVDLVVTAGTTIQWYDVATGGTALDGTVSLVDGQIYYATQTDATTGCESSVRTPVTATIYQSPNVGSPAAPIVACNSATIDLNLGLDGTQDSGGVWYEGPDNTGAVISNPTTYDVTGFSANTYQLTYYVTASAPCVEDSITITITIEEPLDAGTDGTPLDLCSNTGTIDLFTQLGGTPDMGGTWSPALASGTGVFDPLVDAPTTYSYTLTNACGSFSSEIEVSVTQAANAGSDNSVLICVIDGVTDLFPLLGSAQTGGVWSPALTSGTGEFDPSVDIAGVYTYTVTAISPCINDSSAQITVTVEDIAAPSVNDPNPEFCLVDNPTVGDLDSSLTATGTINWYTDNTLSTPLNATDALVDGEDYFATQTNSSGCESTQNVQVDVTVNDTPTPTLTDSNLELCINDSPTVMDLTLNINEYTSSLNNVIWYDSATNGSAIASSSLLGSGITYYAALYDATTGCESSIRLVVTPDLSSCGKIALPDGFSPNGDGVNDTYDYNNLDVIYPNFEIEIFNRYGNVVYKGNANSPRFDGASTQSGTLGSGKLPVGVYFYIFRFNDGENKPEQGRFYLSR